MASMAMGFQDSIGRFLHWPLVLLCAALAVLACVASQCGCSPAFTPCSPTDVEGELYLQNCETRIQNECGGKRDASCPVVAECTRWAEQRCSEAR